MECKKCANGYTKETCPKRKYENHRLMLSGIIVVLIGVIMYMCRG